MYEKTQPAASGLLTTSDGQVTYWEESGTQDGIPLLYLHGGPGAGLGSRGYVTKADPSRFRVIGLDQRGCGKSVPLACDADGSAAPIGVAHRVSWYFLSNDLVLRF